MSFSPHSIATALAALTPILLAASGAAAHASSSYHFGSLDAGLDLRLEVETPGGPWYLHAQHDEGSGYVSLMPPLRLEAIPTDAADDHASGHVLEGGGLAAGRAVVVRVRLDDDAAFLEWLAPEALASGSIFLPMTGRHPRQSEDARLRDAKARFSSADAALNALYAALRKAMPAEAFAELRDNQRRWLRFRDHFIADGDDVILNGPGTVPFLCEQARRTHQRIDFLRTVKSPPAPPADGVSGIYGDGIGRTLGFALIPSADRHAFISLASAAVWLHDPALGDNLVFAGRTSPVAGNSWESGSGMITANRVANDPAEMLFQIIDDGRRMGVSEAVGHVFTGRYWRLAPLTPARAPMRELVRRLPARVFDETEEGLTGAEKTQLLLTGATEIFTLQQTSEDFLRVRYRVGQMDLRRFARVDGGAVVAISTTNVRARHFALWLLPADNSDPLPIDLDRPPWPAVSATDFFFATTGDTSALDRQRIDYGIDDSATEIRIRLRPNGNARAADRGVDLIWDGHGFGAVRLDRPTP